MVTCPTTPKSAAQKSLLKTKQPAPSGAHSTKPTSDVATEKDGQEEPPTGQNLGSWRKKGKDSGERFPLTPPVHPQAAIIATAIWDNLGTHSNTSEGSLCNYWSAGFDDCDEPEAAVSFPFTSFQIDGLKGRGKNIWSNLICALQFITGWLEAGDFLLVYRLTDHEELYMDSLNRTEN